MVSPVAFSTSRSRESGRARLRLSAKERDASRSVMAMVRRNMKANIEFGVRSSEFGIREEINFFAPNWNNQKMLSKSFKR
jgi:hypothetical protein